MFQVGTSKADITPEPGMELCGFAMREQPSDRVLDPLYASVIYIKNAEEGLFLINLDLIGIERDFAVRIRENIRIKYNIPENHIQIFASHTHSGPGTVHLNFCGEYDPEYLDFLIEKIIRICGEAIENIEDCYASFTENELNLGINRRRGVQSELTLKVLIFIKVDGGIKAVLLNYPMHPVCLKGQGISADYPGIVKQILSQKLQGNPLVLFGLGAAGDIDPPGVGVEYKQMVEWGEKIAEAFLELRKIDLTEKDKPFPNGYVKNESSNLANVLISSEYFEITAVKMSEEGIDAYADKYLEQEKWHREFGKVFGLAVEKWRKDMKSRIGEKAGLPGGGFLEISVLEIAGVKLIFVSGELFQKFERIMNKGLDSPIITISCANGLEGYFPSEEEYEKGGYEVETAIFFYNSFLPRKGSLEQIAEKAVQLAKKKE